MKNIKKLLSITFILLILLIPLQPVFSAQRHLIIRLGDKSILVKVEESEGKLFFPLRKITEGLGLPLNVQSGGTVVFLNKDSGIVMLKVEENFYWMDGKRIELSTPARLIGDQIVVPLDFVKSALGIDIGLDEFKESSEVASPPDKIGGVEGRTPPPKDEDREIIPSPSTYPTQAHSQLIGFSYRLADQSFRFIFELDRRASYNLFRLYNPPRLVLDLDNTQLGSPTKELIVNTAAVERIRMKQRSGNTTRIVFDLSYDSIPYSHYIRPKPYQIIIDVARYYERESKSTPLKGIERFHLVRLGEAGPLNINALRIDLYNPDIEVRPAVPSKGFAEREETSLISLEEGAIAAINGAFYGDEGDPVGLLMINGSVLSDPISHRSAMAITSDRHVIFSNFSLIATVKVNGQKAVKVNGINRRMRTGEIILYTPEYGKTTKTDKCNEAAIMRGRVVSLRTTGDMMIPRDGFVLSWQGRAELNNLKFWDKIELSFSFNSSRSDIVHAIGGGPRLVRGGRLFITSDMEQFREDVTAGRAPRSAVGVTSSGKLLLVTVDGRQPGKSVGMTLEELGKLMLELGAVEAMNLDGGGSTTMVIGGKVVNYPSAGEERKISSALLVFHQDYRQ